MSGTSKRKTRDTSNQPETCVIESKGIGKVCVDSSGFMITLTDETMTRVKERLKVMHAVAGEQDATLLDASLRALDKGMYVTSMPVSDVTGVGVFPYKDSKDEMIFAVAVTPELARATGMERPVALLRMKREDASIMERSTPRTITRISDVEKLVNRA